MIVLGIFNGHDAGAALFDDYRMVAAVALERMTRKKGDGHRFPDEAVDECLAVAGITRADVDVLALPTLRYARRYVPGAAGRGGDDEMVDFLREAVRRRIADFEGVSAIFDSAGFLADHGFTRAKAHFYNHHFAHILTALFHTDWDEGVLYSHDGVGDRMIYSAWRLAGGHLAPIFGRPGDSFARIRRQMPSASIGHFYAHATKALGFRPLRHEGKVLGLAAMGEPRFAKSLGRGFFVSPSGQIYALHSGSGIQKKLAALVAASEPREDIAASVQAVTVDVCLRAVSRIMARAGSRRLAVAGGLFANVRVNQILAETLGLDELFVYPAMSDQGQAAGGALDFLLARDGETRWLGERFRFDTLYYGRDYTADAARALREVGAVADPARDVAQATADRIQKGAAVGTFLERMEYGPRALGARTIMAAAIDRTINDSLNKRLDRTEFMPFAPVVLAERATDVFDLPASLAYSANFMTTTCAVRPAWRDRIPAVVHVDNTARPQLIRRDQNPLYYDIIARYERMTGLPTIINTSFNAHEEPIINTPAEAAAALKAGRVDAIVTEGALWSMPGAAERRASDGAAPVKTGAE